MAGSQLHCTDLSEVLSCVCWLLTMVCESLVGLCKFTAGLKSGEITPQIHFPNAEMHQSQRQQEKQKKTDSALF